MIYHKPPKENADFLLNSSNEFSYPVFTLARQAIYHFFRQFQGKSILLPAYTADGVYLPLKQLGFKIHFYDLDLDLHLQEDYFNNFNPQNTIVYYIHHYGLWIDDNVKLLQNLKDKGFLIVEDKALTLPYKKVKTIGDIEVYSWHKLLGLPCGGAVISEKYDKLVCNGGGSIKSSELKTVLKIFFYFYSNHFIRFIPPLPFRIYNKLVWQLFGKNLFVIYEIPETISLADPIIKKQICKIDFVKVSTKRILNAEILYKNIHPKYLLPVGKGAYLRQSLIGFPIMVDDQGRMMKYLLKRGVHGFALRNGWKPDELDYEPELLKSVFLLPVHHYLNDKELIYTSKILNEL